MWIITCLTNSSPFLAIKSEIPTLTWLRVLRLFRVFRWSTTSRPRLSSSPFPRPSSSYESRDGSSSRAPYCSVTHSNCLPFYLFLFFFSFLLSCSVACAGAERYSRAFSSVYRVIWFNSEILGVAVFLVGISHIVIIIIIMKGERERGKKEED